MSLSYTSLPIYIKAWIMFLHIWSLLRAWTLEKGFHQWQLIPIAGQVLVEMDLTRHPQRRWDSVCGLSTSQFGGTYKMHLKVQVPGTLEDKQAFV